MSNKEQLQNNNLTLEQILSQLKDMASADDCMRLLQDKIDNQEGLGLAGFGSSSDGSKNWETVIVIDSKTGTPTIKKIPKYVSDLENDGGFTKISTYTGTGSKGKSYPTKIPYSGEPKLFIMIAENNMFPLIATYGQTSVVTINTNGNSLAKEKQIMSWDEGFISFYTDGLSDSTTDGGTSYMQYNSSGKEYKCVFIY